MTTPTARPRTERPTSQQTCPSVPGRGWIQLEFDFDTTDPRES
jgi:hypothetical protein